jgi:hypothetical protein
VLKVDVRGIAKSSKSYCGYDNKAEREDDLMFWFAVAALLEYEDSRSVDPCSNGKLTEQATVA